MANWRLKESHDQRARTPTKCCIGGVIYERRLPRERRWLVPMRNERKRGRCRLCADSTVGILQIEGEARATRRSECTIGVVADRQTPIQRIFVRRLRLAIKIALRLVGRRSAAHLHFT